MVFVSCALSALIDFYIFRYRQSDVAQDRARQGVARQRAIVQYFVPLAGNWSAWSARSVPEVLHMHSVCAFVQCIR